MARVLSLCRLVRAPQQPLRLAVRSMSLDQRAREVFSAAVESVQPDRVVRRSLERRGDQLEVAGRSFKLQHNVHLVGFGKAVLGMAAEAEKIIGEHLVKGVISVPNGIQETLRQHGKEQMLLSSGSRITVMEGAKHNLPDADAQQAADSIRQLASSLTDTDLLLVLISGGGSALLPAPVPPISLQEKQDVTRSLAAAGATIQELNTVRRSLSLLKGGGLAACAKNAQVVALILSDVIGDPLDLIASGPTVECEIWPEQVWAILNHYGLPASSLPASVTEVLENAGHKTAKLSADGSSGDNSRITNAIIGSNSIALECAGRRARELGLRPLVLSPSVSGDVRSVARLYGLLARYASGPHPATSSQAKHLSQLADKLLQLGPEVGIESWDLMRTMKVLEDSRDETWGATCLLAGGEPTVQLTGKGRGGRNQELALRVGLELGEGLGTNVGGDKGPVFLSGGTDGQDGPTEAAGAVTDGALAEEARGQGLETDDFLVNNDSFTFFTQLRQGQRILMPGLTGTNVMDVHIMLLPPPPALTD